MTGYDQFQFLNVERTLSSAEDWNNAEWPKLWVFNAHYFDDLTAANATQRAGWHRTLLTRWVIENPPAKGNGWEPYPTSLRIVNWVKWVLAGNHLDDVVLQSLAVQARMLRSRLEIHLLGNHLWANAKALVFVGVVFEGEESAAWLTKGITILRDELGEQILADGGHFERSPMYHTIILEDLMDLVQLAMGHPVMIDENEVIRWRATAARMLRWLRVMSHPDGDIAMFNDAAMGIAPDLKALTSYANVLGIVVDDAPLEAIEALPDSGYVRMQAGPAVLIADVGLIGPNYLPGHAHADTLSFELSLHGQRIMVNGGTSTYETGIARLQQRGTAMHNTVEVDGADSSEVWSSFRVARRARPLDVRWGSVGDAIWLEAGHDGYLRLPGKVIHRRRWALAPDQLRVVDTLGGQFAAAKAYFRFAPGHAAEADIAGAGNVRWGENTLRWRGSGATSMTIEAGTWHPRFGSNKECEVLVAAFTGANLETEFHWD